MVSDGCKGLQWGRPETLIFWQNTWYPIITKILKCISVRFWNKMSDFYQNVRNHKLIIKIQMHIISKKTRHIIFLVSTKTGKFTHKLCPQHVNTFCHQHWWTEINVFRNCFGRLKMSVLPKKRKQEIPTSSSSTKIQTRKKFGKTKKDFVPTPIEFGNITGLITTDFFFRALYRPPSASCSNFFGAIFQMTPGIIR